MVDADSDTPPICRRCGRQLTPGAGDHYVVRIEAVADPTPPAVDPDEPTAEIAAEIEQLIESMQEMSEQELMDQVHRRMVFHLCARCYAQWIEDPTG